MKQMLQEIKSLMTSGNARYAVDAVMAGKTDMMVGYWHGESIHVPLDSYSEFKEKS